MRRESSTVVVLVGDVDGELIDTARHFHAGALAETQSSPLGRFVTGNERLGLSWRGPGL